MDTLTARLGPLELSARGDLPRTPLPLVTPAPGTVRRNDLLINRYLQAGKGLLEAGWDVEIPKASMYIWAEIPEPYRAAGSLEFAKRMLADAKVAVSPGIGFGDYGDSHVRFALIENEQRIRQAVRGIKEMFRKDGLMPKAAA